MMNHTYESIGESSDSLDELHADKVRQNHIDMKHMRDTKKMEKIEKTWKKIINKCDKLSSDLDGKYHLIASGIYKELSSKAKVLFNKYEKLDNNFNIRVAEYTFKSGAYMEIAFYNDNDFTKMIKSRTKKYLKKRAECDTECQIHVGSEIYGKCIERNFKSIISEYGYILKAVYDRYYDMSYISII